MSDKADVPSLKSPDSITDDQIVTDRKIQRRSFLNTTGALLAGAAGIVSGARASGHGFQTQTDPDQKKPSDPDQKKAADPDKKKASDPDQKKSADPDQKKASDPDQKKSSDPNKKKSTDPDRAPQ
ncbi:MAG TPA: hypothetical protein VHZ55_06965 [Bryobacteraceae bacterium]|jgi:hypothetical protein|nr:hypothetical protein [Bryobacteraceae bacterium]